MRVPTLAGMIDRRILVNYRIDADAAAAALPSVFRPKLVRGKAIGGICLIRLKHVRPAWLKLPIGIGSENAAHRFAVEWDTPHGVREGVYIPRRDTDSKLNTLVGGRLFPGEHHHARFIVNEQDSRYDVRFYADDGQASAAVQTRVAQMLPDDSVFGSLIEASHFFEKGSLGYSGTAQVGRLDGLELACEDWTVKPLEVVAAQSSFFDDKTRFPEGSVSLDHALLMRNIPHRWHAHASLCCDAAEVTVPPTA